MSTHHPRVLAMRDAMRTAGIRTKLTQEFERGGPDLLVGKDGQNKPLLWVSRGEIAAGRPQVPPEIERYIRWWNDSSSPKVPIGIQVATPAQAVAAANLEVDPAEGLPTVVVAPPPGPSVPIPDAFTGSFKHNAYGEWNNYARAADDRITLSEVLEGNGGQNPQSAIVNFLVKNGDANGRCEAWCALEPKIFRANDVVDIEFWVSFPPDYPVYPTNRQVHFVRLSAFTNGLPPLEFMTKMDGAGVQKVWLRSLGSDHDLLGQSTLDVAGGYLWSTPLVRAVSYANMNWLKLMLRVKFSTDPAVGWLELYKDYNYTTPIMARVAAKTMTDTSGTVRDYLRIGINRHTSITGDTLIRFANVRYTITRP